METPHQSTGASLIDLRARARAYRCLNP